MPGYTNYQMTPYLENLYPKDLDGKLANAKNGENLFNYFVHY